MSDTVALGKQAKPGLDEERKRGLVAWWEAIRAGSLAPAPLAVPAPVRKLLDADLAAMTVRPTAAYQRFSERSATLDYLHGGHGVLTLDVPGGFVVLAVGEAEWHLFYDSMPRDFVDRAEAAYPETWDEEWPLG